MAQQSGQGLISVPLSALAAGERGRVTSLKGAADLCSRLRELGFCEEAIVECISGSHTLLCNVCGTRIALNCRVAQHVFVERLAG